MTWRSFSRHIPKVSIFFVTQASETVKKRALEMSQGLLFWYRQKYNLPETDPRILELTELDLAEEYWAYRYWEVIKNERRVPSEDEFDTDWIDSQMARWEIEDEEELKQIEQEKKLIDIQDEWEEVKLNG